MSGPFNRQIILAARPRGEPKESDFRLVETAIPEPGPGQMRLRTIDLSLDPYMRGRMNAGPSYAPPVEIGQVMVGGTVSPGRRLHHRNFSPGISSMPIPGGRTSPFPTDAGYASWTRGSPRFRRRWACSGCRA